jgi:hypothetical protein
MSAKIWLNHMQRLPQPRMGRRLRGLLTANGFTNIGLAAGVVMHTDFEHSKRVFGLTAAAVRAAVTGIIADEEAEGWLADLQRASDTKQFFCAVTTFRVSGFKA